MTDIDLNTVEGRVKAALEGSDPLKWGPEYVTDEITAFIVNAPADILALIDRVRELEDQLKEKTEELEGALYVVDELMQRAYE